MSELKFTRVNNTVSINIENAIIEMKKKDYRIFYKHKTEIKYKDVHFELLNYDIIEKLKTWETEINEYLKNEMGAGPVKIVYGNKLYTKYCLMLTRENKHFIKIGGVWIDENNISFVQLYYIEHMVYLI